MGNVNASIVTIGDELLIGQTIDTNSAFIAQEMNKAGVWVHRRVAVGDRYDEIWKTLEQEGAVSDIVIITGGLGPTADDITKPLLCDFFGGKLVVNEEVLAHVKMLFEKIYRRPGPILERNLKQAEVPDNCVVLHNARGTAPGMWFPASLRAEKVPGPSGKGTVYVSLPGVPHEMKGLITTEVMPRVLREFELPAIIHKTAYTAGKGESAVAEMLGDFENKLPPHIRLAYLPGYGMVKLRLTGTGSHLQDLEAEIQPFFESLLDLVRDCLVADEDIGLEVVIGRILKERKQTLGTAESCTGGFIAHRITSVPGSSAYFKGSVVSYANEIKEKLLGVDPETLRNRGAVGEETVMEMVRGAIRRLDVDFALAVSGIMGPDGGSPEKPVGTVWVAVGNRQREATLQLHLRFDRERNIQLTTLHALNFLRQFILETPRS